MIRFAIFAAFALSTATVTACSGAASDPASTNSQTSLGGRCHTDEECACSFEATDVDGDTLSEMRWADEAEIHFFAFTGNGTERNDGGDFTSEIAPPCTRAMPACDMPIVVKRGTFVTHGASIDIRYANGDTATFDAKRDCKNRWRITGRDYSQTLTLTVTTIEQ